MANSDANGSNWIRYSEMALWINAIGAIYGGGFIIGGARGLPLDLLDGSPFSDFAIPGVILLVVVGGTSLLAATARNRKWDNMFLLTLLAGVILLGWIIVEFLMIPEGWIPQLIFMLISVPMIVGGWIGCRKQSN